MLKFVETGFEISCCTEGQNCLAGK